jgi:hypothetical protein
MQLRKHVHGIAPDVWPRCGEVDIDQDHIGYKLAEGRAYDLVKAYAEEPHVEFANCRNDADFRKFLLRFGPLHVNEVNLKHGFGVVRLRDYQAASRFLRALIQIMDACKKPQDPRAPLVEFLSSLLNNVAPGPLREAFKQCISLEEISPLAGSIKTGDPAEWAQHASVTDVRKALASCVEDWFSSPSRWGFRVQPKGKVFEIKPSFELNSLWDAMRWMLFFDEWNRRPPVLCQECPTIFRPQTAHKKKFCSPECAHRAANRDWRRKDLRKQKANRKQKGDSNVTDETR